VGAPALARVALKLKASRYCQRARVRPRRASQRTGRAQPVLPLRLRLRRAEESEDGRAQAGVQELGGRARAREPEARWLRAREERELWERELAQP